MLFISDFFEASEKSKANYSFLSEVSYLSSGLGLDTSWSKAVFLIFSEVFLSRQSSILKLKIMFKLVPFSRLLAVVNVLVIGSYWILYLIQSRNFDIHASHLMKFLF